MSIGLGRWVVAKVGDFLILSHAITSVNDSASVATATTSDVNSRCGSCTDEKFAYSTRLKLIANGKISLVSNCSVFAIRYP